MLFKPLQMIYFYFQINSRDETEKTVKVSLPDNATASVFLRDAMSVEEFLASACSRKNLNPTEHFVRVKKRRDMEDHNYFVPHRSDLIETYVSFSFSFKSSSFYNTHVDIFCDINKVYYVQTKLFERKCVIFCFTSIHKLSILFNILLNNSSK